MNGWYIEGAYTTHSNRFNRNVWIPASAKRIQRFRKKHKNAGLFLSAFLYRQPIKEDAQDPVMLGNLYFDFDCESSLDRAREDVLYMIDYFHIAFGISTDIFRIYFSGCKGFHLVIPHQVFDLKPAKQLNRQFKHLAEQVAGWATNGTMDIKIYDQRRVFRMTGSRHEKTGRYKIPLRFSELNELDAIDIQKMAFRPRFLPYPCPKPVDRAKQHYEQLLQLAPPVRSVKRQKTLDFCPPCIKHILTTTTMQGQRNNTAAVLSSYCIARDFDDIKALELLHQWNDTQVKPSLPMKELEFTYTHMAKKKKYEYGCNTLGTYHCDAGKCRIGKAMVRSRKPVPTSAERQVGALG